MDLTDARRAEILSETFANRLSKNFKRLRKWARQNSVTCYRVYDRDAPEIPVALDLYEFLPREINDKNSAGEFLKEELSKISTNDPRVRDEISSRQFAVLQFYEKRGEPREDGGRVLREKIAEAAARVLRIEKSRVIVKTRERSKGGSQYARDEKFAVKNSASAARGIVEEGGSLFIVDLDRGIDTGLFLDHRALRAAARKICAGKRVLNLFCYTGAFSVCAAEGGASSVHSVDLSNSYIGWAKENMRLNGFCDERRIVFFKMDVKEFLREAKARSALYDVIILDPPTFSNSKSTRETIDIRRDCGDLAAGCAELLDRGGALFFSTNSRRAKIGEEVCGESGEKFRAEEITGRTIDADFARRRPHRCWKITRAENGARLF